jgi:PAS domain S-box-containing protein
MYREKIQILVVDDDEDDFFMISDYIKDIEGNQADVRWCNTYDQAAEELCSGRNDLYFIDYRLGNKTGLELLKHASKIRCDDPIILLTGKGNKAIDIEAMEYGATDYLIKSELNSEKLERCIRYSLDRAQAIRSLRESENKYRNLFESSKDAVFIADNRLRFREINNASAELFQISSDELLNKTLFDFIAQEEATRTIVKALENHESVSEYELEIRTNSNEVRHCLLSFRFQDNRGESVYVHGIIHDITNLKNIEKGNLLAQKQAANERLVQILAHEIRNPLNNIRLSIDHIKIPEGDEKQKNLLAIIQRNCIRINSIITELIDSTRPGELTFEKNSLQDVMEESLVNASDRINLQKVKLSKSYSEKPLEVLCDKTKLKIAFSNILINAIEAMEAEKGSLEVTVTDTPEAYKVSIRDNGKGIPQEYLPKLFEPFFTLKKNGVGLGLAASYSIIQSHKARVEVKSTLNVGTNFIISFDKNSEYINSAN